MYYVYILQSTKDKQLYTGCTNDLKKRLVLHNAGKVPSTVSRRPLQIIFYEAFISKEDAFAREQWLKTGWGRNHVKKLLERYLKSCGGYTPTFCSTIFTSYENNRRSPWMGT